MASTRSMRFLLLFLLAGALAASASGQAIPAASGPGFYLSVGGEASAFETAYGQHQIYGGTVFADLHVMGRYNLEGEARFLRYQTDLDPERVTKQTNYLIGPRVQVWRSQLLRPYVKFLVGDGRVTFPYDYATGSYFAMAPGAGLDVHLNDNVEVRLIDFEYQYWPKFEYLGPVGPGGATEYQFADAHPYGISAGISFRLTRPNLFRHDPYVDNP